MFLPGWMGFQDCLWGGRDTCPPPGWGFGPGAGFLAHRVRFLEIVSSLRPPNNQEIFGKSVNQSHIRRGRGQNFGEVSFSFLRKIRVKIKSGSFKIIGSILPCTAATLGSSRFKL